MNSFGSKFRISIFGESHGDMIGVVMDGVPPGVALCVEDFAEQLGRRRAGALGTTQRIESDVPTIVSGVKDGATTGAPLTVVFRNEDVDSKSYASFEVMPRPGHADFTSSVKYLGWNDLRGGGHFSGRMTLCLVAAGVVARRAFFEEGDDVSAKVVEVGGRRDAAQWDDVLRSAMSEGDSVGGVVECCMPCPLIGLGEPFFDSVESMISHLVFSIGGVRGIEFGDGFEAARMRGSEHNDSIVDVRGRTSTNGAGGVNGGITNGNPLVFCVAVKPTSSIAKAQQTFDFEKEEPCELEIKGRHDTCIALRFPAIVEAVVYIALANC